MTGTQSMGKRSRFSVKSLVIYIVLSLGAITMLAPFIWMLLSSLMTSAEMFYFPPKWIPNPPHWENYVETVTAMPFFLFIWNTFFISAVGTFGMLLTSSVAGYTFARMRFPGKTLIFSVLMACMMIPGQVTMIPTFILMSGLG